MSTNKRIIPVILCGGSGTRLWPKSSAQKPKQFLKLLGDDSLLQATVKRALNVAGCSPADILTLTHVDMIPEVERHYSVLDESLKSGILGEPCARNTAAAIALAALYVREIFGPDALIWVLPSDHHIGDEAALAEALQCSATAATQGRLVTFGIRPSRPETGYGYIKTGHSLGGGVHAVERFVEKPDSDTALTFLQSGDYLWNSGMFVFTARHVLAAYQTHAAPLLSTLEQAVNFADGTMTIDPFLYVQIEATPFDIAIMEKIDNAASVPTNPLWSDIGSWQSLWEAREKDESGNVARGDVTLKNCRDVLVESDEKPVVCIGLENIAVVMSEDSVLITRKDIGDDIKDIATHMQNRASKNAKGGA